MPARNKRRSSSRPAHRKTRTMTLEPLQERWTPVVGAFSVPAALDWSKHDGVVQVNATFSNGRSVMGSGSLLSSGQHILTAAHVVTQDSGSTLTSLSVDFKMKEHSTAPTQFERYTVSLPAASVNVHPGWDGMGDNDANHDLAVIRLDALAPQNADRLQLYRGSDEVGKYGTIVGFGRTGTGNRGDTVAPDGNRRSATNRIDDTEYDPLFGGTAGPDRSVLVYDFDKLAGEGFAAPGDSGGPVLIGGKVAGVTSAAWETSFLGGKPESEFGEVGTATRVSYFARWIDTAMAAPRNVRLDLTKEVGDSDGVPDQVEVVTLGDLVQIKLNGRLHDLIPASQISRLTLVGTRDHETFTFSGAGSFPFAMNIQGGSGNDTIRSLDETNNFRIEALNGGRFETRHTFTGIESLVGGAQHDTFVYTPSGFLSGSIDGGGGNDTLDYGLLTTGVTVDLFWGNATGVGSGIRRMENVNGGKGNDNLYGNELANILNGGDGDDRLEGRDGGDLLIGGNHNDTLLGGRGADTLQGGKGNDTLDGGSDWARDRLFGGGDKDTFWSYADPLTMVMEDLFEDFETGRDVKRLVYRR